jgi:hypothetical protein
MNADELNTIKVSANEWARARKDLEEALNLLRYAQKHNASPDRIADLQRSVEYFTWRIRNLTPR